MRGHAHVVDGRHIWTQRRLRPHMGTYANTTVEGPHNMSSITLLTSMTLDKLTMKKMLCAIDIIDLVASTFGFEETCE